MNYFKRKHITWRNFVLFLAGLLVSAFGVACASKLALGVTPLSVLAYVFSEAFTPTIGQFLIMQHTLFLIIQILLLRKRFNLINLLQVPMAVLYGEFTDFAVWCLKGIEVDAYPERMVFCILAVFLTGFGVFMTVNADVMLLAGEGLTQAIAIVTKQEFGRTKIEVDCGLLVLGAALSLIFLRRIVGIREGTAILAVFVGMFVQLLNSHRSWVNIFLHGKVTPEAAEAEYQAAKPHLVITFAREFGGAGMQVVYALSNLMDLHVYDDELTEMEIAESGLPAEFVRENEHRMSKSLLDYMSRPYSMNPEPTSETDKLYEAQKRVVQKVADEHDCIIVGRTAVLTLGRNKSYFHVLLHQKFEERVEASMKEFSLDEASAQKLVRRGDSERKQLWSHRAGRAWGLAKDYDLCVDLTDSEPEKIAEVIAQAARARLYSNHEAAI